MLIWPIGDFLRRFFFSLLLFSLFFSSLSLFLVVEYCRSKGIIHRDIYQKKNILLSKDHAYAFLADWGFSEKVFFLFLSLFLSFLSFQKNTLSFSLLSSSLSFSLSFSLPLFSSLFSLFSLLILSFFSLNSLFFLFSSLFLSLLSFFSLFSLFFLSFLSLFSLFSLSLFFSLFFFLFFSLFLSSSLSSSPSLLNYSGQEIQLLMKSVVLFIMLPLKYF